MSKKSLSLLARILVISIGGMAATASISLWIATSSLRSMSEGIVETIYAGLLEGVVRSLSTSATIAYGSLALDGDRLLGEGSVEVGKTSQVVDLVTRQSALGAAILRRGETSFVVAQTSIRGEDSKRAIGAVLPLDSPAGSALAEGRTYSGRVSIAASNYIIRAEPVVDDSGRTVAGLLVGQSLASVEMLTAQGYSAIRSRLMLWSAVAALAGCAIAFLFLRSSLKPLRRTVSALRDIAAAGGDLTLRIDAERNDETGQLARHFNSFIDRLRGEFRRMKAETESMRGHATSLERGAKNSSSSATRISRELEELEAKVAVQSASVSEASSAVARISQRIDALDRRIADEVEAIESSSGWIGTIARGIDSLNSKVVALVGLVDSLKAASRDGREAMRAAMERVGEASRMSDAALELNDLMSEVAARTSILSINAAIEAARAGKSGGGFAVVADEIRLLSEEAAARSQETGENIIGIREAVSRLVEASREVSGSCGRVDDSVVHAGDALGHIAGEMASQLTNAVCALDDLSRTGDSTKAILAGSTEMKASGRLIIDEMRTLLESARRIEDGIRTISEESETIASESALTAEAAKANSLSAAALEAELAPYKTERDGEEPAGAAKGMRRGSSACALPEMVTVL